MPIDPKKRQKQVMKKRRKAKLAASKRIQNALVALSTRALLRKAREFPIVECHISRAWKKQGEEGLVQVVIARKQPDGAVVVGTYLLDVYCLGLKDTFADAGVRMSVFRERILAGLHHQTPMEKCPPELAHQIIYQAIDYAAKFGFRPQKDWKFSQFVLEKRGTFKENYDLKFGKDGKPFFIQGPYDNAKAIIDRLERTAGSGNYDYVAMVGNVPPDFFDDWDELDDDSGEDIEDNAQKT
jgi:hypothetical protein